MELAFEPIHLEKQHDYQRFLANCPQVASDYSFLNLWGWGEDYQLRWAWEEDLVWIKQNSPEERFWAPIGAWDAIDWKARFHEDKGKVVEFIRIPQTLADYWGSRLNDHVKIAEDRGHWDYLYSVGDLIELKGNRYHKKKNLVNQFNKKYDYTYVPLGTDLVEEAMGMQADWCTWRDCESSEILSAENRSIFKILKDWNRLDGAIGGAIMVDHSMVAYTVAEALTNDTVLIHFEKGDTEYKGVYQAINQIFLEQSARHFSFVNREQDLDDEGLRKAKLSYHPADFLRKYRVTLSGSFIL